jgi:hypothetical protein
MPARTPSEARDVEVAIQAAVARLSRPDGEGGIVIERAAIVAEGEPALAIEAWIMAHGGQPEAPLLHHPRPGLYGARNESFADGFGARPPRRYVLPAAAVE